MFWLQTYCDARHPNPNGVKVASDLVWLVIIIEADGNEHYLYGFHCPVEGCHRVNLREIPRIYIGELLDSELRRCMIDMSVWDSQVERPELPAVSDAERETWHDQCCNPDSAPLFYQQLARYGMYSDTAG